MKSEFQNIPQKRTYNSTRMVSESSKMEKNNENQKPTKSDKNLRFDMTESKDANQQKETINSEGNMETKSINNNENKDQTDISSNIRKNSFTGSKPKSDGKQNNKDQFNIQMEENSSEVNSNSQNYIDNSKNRIKLVTLLESLINEIKNEGFVKFKEEINEKIQIKQELESNIDLLQRKKANLNTEGKHLNSNQSKFIIENQIFSDKAERLRREVFFYNKDLPYLHNEVEYMKFNIDQFKSEEKEIKTIIFQEESEIESLKEEIRKLNLSISEINKEKEATKNITLTILKQNSELKSKINDKIKSIQEFMGSIKKFVKESIKPQKKR